jgi:lipopolysaccharide/colanic/teichoic acid biosynthesis glycosyltransferase
MGLLLIADTILSQVRRRFEVARYVLVPPVHLNCIASGGMLLQRPESPEMAGKGILVVEPDAVITHEWLRFIAKASAAGQRVISRRHLQERMTGRVETQDLTVMEMESFTPAWPLLFAKRFLDIFIVLLLLPLALPLGLLVGLLVRLDSPGRVIFLQERIGKSNKPFLMLKFRSMREEVSSEARFANQESDRITRLGYFIRATHLDELPQLVNVLKGDMSLVGPRPEQPDFVAEFEKEMALYSYRHLVRPGITGWAQVCQGYAADAEATQEKLSYDFFYIKNLSLWLDILILVRTVRSVLFDRHPEAID